MTQRYAKRLRNIVAGLMLTFAGCSTMDPVDLETIMGAWPSLPPDQQQYIFASTRKFRAQDILKEKAPNDAFPKDAMLLCTNKGFGPTTKVGFVISLEEVLAAIGEWSGYLTDKPLVEFVVDKLARKRIESMIKQDGGFLEDWSCKPTGALDEGLKQAEEEGKKVGVDQAIQYAVPINFDHPVRPGTCGEDDS